MQGVRSTNGAPFRFFEAAAADAAGLGCPEPAAPVLGCGAIIHGIGFAYDSAEITRESAQVIAKLHAGLRDESAGSVLIEGHTSSEGTDAYNLDLSARRARAVVAALEQLGMPAGRLSAAGLGETRPIADNGDESGRSMNRRVEVHCRAP
jgi:outer membrane protein OmpA-like peptidoglycan-associated protein